MSTWALSLLLLLVIAQAPPERDTVVPYYDDMSVAQRREWFESQQPLWSIEMERYWEDHRVALFVYPDSGGPPVLLASHATREENDSLLIYVRDVIYPALIPEPTLIGFSLVRSLSADSLTPLPDSVVLALESDPLAGWFTTLRPGRKVTPGEFGAYSTMQLLKVRARGMLNSDERLEEKARIGVLHTSPDSSLVLDPFTGVEFSNGVPGYDVDTGFSLFIAKSGDRTYSQVSTSESVDAAHWIDSEHFILLGTLALQPPAATPSLRLFVSCIWYVNATTGEMKRFLGPPRMWPHPKVREARARLRSAVYPGVRWR